MAPNFNLKPETALTKAHELIRVGKKMSALEILFDMMKSRRAKIWQKKLEELMLLFTDLCVELKKNMHFKRIIHQYKNITAQECPQSLEEVLKHYLESIKAKTKEAQKQSKDAVPYVEDLDVLETPESLMLNAVSVEGAQDRSDRTILMPWLKFLWDSYRISLDLLKSSVKFELMYHDVARETYEFCQEYNRKAEFRKLTETLRLHTQKFQTPLVMNATNNVNLNNPETQLLHFSTRLQQLDTAMDLEMYNEAFKTVEDIWSFILMSKKVSKPVLMVDYYSKTADLFLRSGCHLFHAAALHKLLALYRDHKKSATREELAALGARVLCATLAVPLPHVRMHFDKFPVTGEQNSVKQKNLASLLGLSQVPTRISLIRDLVRNRLPQLVSPELAQLYHAMEVDFQPLKLTERVTPALELLSSDEGKTSGLSVYADQLADGLVSKTLLQLSQVYRTLTLDSLAQLCPYMPPLRLERCVVELTHNLELPIRIDHRRRAIVFDVFTDLGISQRQYGGQGAAHVGTPDQLSRQLVLFAQALYQVTEMLHPVTLDGEVGGVGLLALGAIADAAAAQHRQGLVQAYQETADSDHASLLSRRDLIEERKEALERLRETRDRVYLEEEARRQAEKERDAADEEVKLAEEAKQRERHRTEEKQAKLKHRIATENYKIIMGSELAGSIDPAQITDDLDQILEKRVQEMSKRRREITEKAKKRATKLDYFVRAVRLEELPLLKEKAAEERVTMRQTHAAVQREVEEKARAEHIQRLKDRERLIRMQSNIKLYNSELKKLREKTYEERMSEWRAECDRVRQERIDEIKRRQEAEAAKAADEAKAAQIKAAEEEAAAAEAAALDKERGYGHRERGPGGGGADANGYADDAGGGSKGFRRGGMEIDSGKREGFGRRRTDVPETDGQSTGLGTWKRGTPLQTKQVNTAPLTADVVEPDTQLSEAAAVPDDGAGEWRRTGTRTGGEGQSRDGGTPRAFGARGGGGGGSFQRGGLTTPGDRGSGGGFGQRGKQESGGPGGFGPNRGGRSGGFGSGMGLEGGRGTGRAWKPSFVRNQPTENS